ncbi:MAG: SLBB domain-containing protein [Deltaproteobacteria bacterium]|nr:SLBB domain-containing protein [Deltaproteobacteria bacterium]
MPNANLKNVLCSVLVGLVVSSLPGWASTSPTAPVTPFAPSPVASLSADQVRILTDALRTGELTPEARAILAANPALETYLPPSYRELLKQGQPEGARAIPAAGTRDQTLRREPSRGGGPGSIELLPAAGAVLPAPEKYDWRRSVYISRLFLERLRDEERQALTHFGHELFDPRPDASSAVEPYPVSDDYVVGPGDEITLKMWGRLEGSELLRVDRDGKVFLPKFGGSLYVAGKTVREVKAFLKKKVEAVPQVYLDVSMGQLSGFRVSVLGEVTAPGIYRATSFHTVLQAIALAGGVRDIGSLRRVQLKRGRETAAEVDLYDFLLRGDVTQDLRLRPGDAIFVPVAGPLIAVTGEVRRQAIHELWKERSIGEALAMAGGLSPSAFKRRVQVERLEGNRARVVLDLDLAAGGSEVSAFALQDGDVVRVSPVLPEDENAVQVRGNVRRAGKYEWRQGLTVGALIPDEKFFQPETFLDYALLFRTVGPDNRKAILPVNLQRIVVEKDRAADIALEPDDELVVYRRSAFRDEKTATVSGEVRTPGTYKVFPGMRVSDLLKAAGDVTRNASLVDAELARWDEQFNPTVRRISLQKALSGDRDEDLAVQDRDVLSVRPVPDLQEFRYITVSGEVVSPGVYAARKGERLSSILRRAGGFTQDAFLTGAVFTRVSVQKRQQELIDRTVEQLEEEVARTAAKAQAEALDRDDIEAQRQVFEARRALLARLKQVRAQGRVILRLAEPGQIEGTENDLLIEDGDKLEVPQPPEVINVVCRVYHPTGVTFNRTRNTLDYFLDKVGGPTEDADRAHIFVVRADGSLLAREQQQGTSWFFRGDSFLRTPLAPGDSIVVPEKLTVTRVMKDVKDITQILYQIAVTAGVLLVAF